MSHSISEVGQILKEHCEQNNKAYQNSVVQTEEESRNIIAKHVLAYAYSNCSKLHMPILYYLFIYLLAF